MSEMKNSLEGINNRLDKGHDQVDTLKKKITVSTQREHKNRRFKRNRENLRTSGTTPSITTSAS